jgi:hypothetical protein
MGALEDLAARAEAENERVRERYRAMVEIDALRAECLEALVHVGRTVGSDVPRHVLSHLAFCVGAWWMEAGVRVAHGTTSVPPRRRDNPEPGVGYERGEHRAERESLAEFERKRGRIDLSDPEQWPRWIARCPEARGSYEVTTVEAFNAEVGGRYVLAPNGREGTIVGIYRGRDTGGRVLVAFEGGEP